MSASSARLRRPGGSWRSPTSSRGSARTSGSRSATPETAQSVGFIWAFPLVFASSAFVPYGDALAPALGTLAWLAGLLLIVVPLSVRAFRRA